MKYLLNTRISKADVVPLRV